MPAKLPSQIEAETAKAGAKAGAKARNREAAESAAHAAAVLQVETDGRAATWTRTYRAGTLEDGTPDRRAVTMRETARREIGGAELLALVGEAVRLAAGRLRARHGIPELSHDERLELQAELVSRLLADHSGELPERAKLTRSYLVERAAGIVLNDPDRAATDADAEVSAESIAADAVAAARDRHDRHDPMLNRGVDGSWPEVAAACATANLPDRVTRTACYLVAGGSVREDWSTVWGVSPGYAATRLVPEGAAKLRDLLSALEESPLYLLISSARRADIDGRDIAAARRAEIERGQRDAPRPPRATVERRWRIEPETHAPVIERTDRRMIRTSDRTRAKAAQRAGWTAPPQ